MRVDPFYVQTLVGALSDATASEAQLSGELASGIRIQNLSTDPVAVAQSTLIAAAINADDTYAQAASSAQSRIQVTDSALGAVLSQLNEAISLATSAGNGTLSPGLRAGIGSQLSEIQGQVLALANTTYLGQHIFGGSQGSTEPFSQVGSTTTYTGDEAVQYVTTANGQKIQTNLPGSTVFDAPGAGVFTALNQVVTDFSSGANNEEITVDIGRLTDAVTAVTAQRGVIGTSLAQVESTSTYALSDAAQLNAAINALVATDPAQVATSLSNVETQSQALLGVIPALEKGSLFDYIR